MFGLKQHDHEIFYHQDHLVFKRTPPAPPLHRPIRGEEAPSASCSVFCRHSADSHGKHSCYLTYVCSFISLCIQRAFSRMIYKCLK